MKPGISKGSEHSAKVFFKAADPNKSQASTPEALAVMAPKSSPADSFGSVKSELQGAWYWPFKMAKT